ncbi:hypothetical protein EUX98_g7119 [Antrodiella citrinella]|uniref:Dienelactone hydrolase domain-containing protein n=1 Tax=Antrodiella citrinella TaxID=2447956 RepID=A0A4S4MML6_9APHY|nr:hypothetical protein EUX98_g7119 [Antrodiella citrinella]
MRSTLICIAQTLFLVACAIPSILAQTPNNASDSLSAYCPDAKEQSKSLVGARRDVEMITYSCGASSGNHTEEAGNMMKRGNPTNVCGAQCTTHCFNPSGGGPDPNECKVVSDALRYDSQNIGNLFNIPQTTNGAVVTMQYKSCKSFFVNQAKGLDLQYCRQDWASVLDYVAFNCQATQNAHGGLCLAAISLSPIAGSSTPESLELFGCGHLISATIYARWLVSWRFICVTVRLRPRMTAAVRIPISTYSKTWQRQDNHNQGRRMPTRDDMAATDNVILGVRHEGVPQGKFENIGGHECYVATPSGDYAHDKVILYLLDLYGLKTDHNKRLADDFARNGFRVIIPDILCGDAMTEERRNHPDFKWDDFRANHTDATWIPILDDVVKALKASGVTRIGTIAHSFGGTPAFYLAYANESHVTILSTPSRMDRGTFEKYRETSRAPLLLHGCEVDRMFTQEVQAVADEVLENGQFHPGYERTYWDGCNHGFASKDDADAKAKAAKEGVFEVSVKFFRKYL